MMGHVWLPWVAGIIEGEGCFVVQHKTLAGGQRVAHIRVVVCMTDEDVIRSLRKRTGMGNVRLRQPRKDAPAHHKPSWEWGVTRDSDSFELMQAIYPFMFSRRQGQIDAAIAAWMASDPVPPRPKRLCEVPGCGKPRGGRGLCKTHWWQWKHKGLHADIADRNPPLHCSAVA